MRTRPAETGDDDRRGDGAVHARHVTTFLVTGAGPGSDGPWTEASAWRCSRFVAALASDTAWATAAVTASAGKFQARLAAQPFHARGPYP